jgi:AraC-like DNA-binding protein
MWAHRPSPSLAPFVASIGYAESSLTAGRELALPTGTPQLLVNLDRDELRTYPIGGGPPTVTRGAAMHGPHDRPSLIDPADQRRIVWVAFRAGGSYPFVPTDAVDLRSSLVDLDDLWERNGGTRFRERLLSAPSPEEVLQEVDRYLLRCVTRPLECDAATATAAADLHHGATVAATADRLGWTPRRLGREFTRRIGLAPKRFARVRRFQRLVRAAAAMANPAGPFRPDWARLAADHGYHDQAHLIHDFRSLAGTTPGSYRPRSSSEPNHVPVSTIAPPRPGSSSAHDCYTHVPAVGGLGRSGRDLVLREGVRRGSW